MPISCECPDCGKRLKAPDSAAGKKVTCPGCGSKISIPLPESADAEPPARPKSPPKRAKPARDPGDEFDFQNLDVDAGMEEIVEDRVPCPMCGEMIKPAASKCRHCGESLRGGGGGKRTKRRRSDSSMPVTIMVAIGIEGLFIALNALGIVGNLLQSNFPGACGSVVRIAIEVALLVGLIQRKSSARTAALVLSAIGLVVMVVCGGFLLSAGAANNPQLAQFQQQGMMTILIVILAGQGVLYIAQIGALLPGSASDYLNQ